LFLYNAKNRHEIPAFAVNPRDLEYHIHLNAAPSYAQAVLIICARLYPRTLVPGLCSPTRVPHP
jgi:hypothetical protein